jgi:hypothetical protein
VTSDGNAAHAPAVLFDVDGTTFAALTDAVQAG